MRECWSLTIVFSGPRALAIAECLSPAGFGGSEVMRSILFWAVLLGSSYDYLVAPWADMLAGHTTGHQDLESWAEDNFSTIEAGKTGSILVEHWSLSRGMEGSGQVQRRVHPILPAQYTDSVENG